MRTFVCAVVSAIGLAAHPAFAQANRTAMNFWNGCKRPATSPPRRRQRNSATALRRLLSTSSPALAATRLIPTAVCSASD